MSRMKKVLILFRKSKFYPDPVICGVIEIIDGSYIEAFQKRDAWIRDFTQKFPEFKDTTFSTEEVEVI